MVGMRQILLIIAVVALVGCGEKEAPEPQAQMQEEREGGVEEDTTPKAEPKAEVKKPLTKEESAKVIEAAIREDLEKPTGELAKADLEKVTKLHLGDNHLTDVKGLEKLTKLEVLILADNQLTDVKGLEKLTQLTHLYLHRNQLTDVKGLEKLTQLKHLILHNNLALTKAQIDQLQKALPKCEIRSNPTK